MTEREQKGLKEDDTLSISAGGGETLVLLKIRSKKVETQQGANLFLPEFSKTLKDKYCYLVLLVNITNKAKDISFTVACGEGLPLDEIIGTYDINYDTASPVKITYYVAKDGNSLVFSSSDAFIDIDGIKRPATLSYDPLKGRAYGKNTYPWENAGKVHEVTVHYKLYFTRENGTITMTGVGSQYINGDPAGSWSYDEKKID